MLIRLPPGWASDAPEVHSCAQEELLLEGDLTLAGVDHGQLDEAIGRVLAAPTLLLERERKGQRSTDDVRPAVIDLSTASVADDPRPHLCAMLATNGRGLRPAELLAAMFPALDPVDTAARVLRTRQLIERDGELREILPVDPIATRAPSGCA